MKAMICPVSDERIDKNAVRIAAGLTFGLIAAYAFTNSIIFIVGVATEFILRVFVPGKRSPLNWLACSITKALGMKEDTIDKAPKMFAARVGLVFSVAASILVFFHPFSAVIVALSLMFFTLLEAVFDICVGCIVYTHVVYPIWGDGSKMRTRFSK